MTDRFSGISIMFQITHASVFIALKDSNIFFFLPNVDEIIPEKIVFFICLNFR